MEFLGRIKLSRIKLPPLLLKNAIEDKLPIVAIPSGPRYHKHFFTAAGLPKISSRVLLLSHDRLRSVWRDIY